MPSTVLLVKSDPDADPRDSCAWIISSAGSSLGTLRPVCLPKISTAGGGVRTCKGMDVELSHTFRITLF